MKKYSYFLIPLFTIFYLLFTAAAPASAHTWRLGTPLVPCGQNVNFPGTADDESKPCDRCQLFHLLKHLIDFGLLFILPVGGTLIFIYAGVLYILSGANPGMQGKARGIFTSTIYATLVIVLAWLITNTILVNLGDNVAANWYQFQCKAN